MHYPHDELFVVKSTLAALLKRSVALQDEIALLQKKVASFEEPTCDTPDAERALAILDIERSTANIRNMEYVLSDYALRMRKG